jgi:hypothetical protein
MQPVMNSWAASLAPTFDASAWLDDFTTLGGGWVSMGGRVAFLTAGIFAPDLAVMMRQIVGWPERLAAVKAQIAARAGEASA